MDANIKTMTRIAENPKDKQAQEGSVNAGFSITGLRDTAWKTAQTIGRGCGFMPYDEAVAVCRSSMERK